jgi:serine/threonine-protein kinase
VYVSDDATNTLSTFEGAHCNARDLTGCPTALPAGGPVGQVPRGIAVDPATRTVYVVNRFGEGESGTVSVIDTRTCNARDTSGCGGTFPRVAAGRGSWGVAIDLPRHRAYTADFGNATLSRIDGTTCNALRTDGCDRPPLFAAIGSLPVDVVVDPTTRTLYADNAADSTVSAIEAR